MCNVGRIFFAVDFNDFGVAEGKIDTAQVGPIAAVRLVIKSASKNWIIISEVCCQNVKDLHYCF